MPIYPPTKAIKEESTNYLGIATIAVHEGGDTAEHVARAIYAIVIERREEASGKIRGSAFATL